MSFPDTATSLRARLRNETRARHEEVEAAFDRFDLDEREGMEGMLTAHRDALAALLPSMVDADPDLAGEIARLRTLSHDSRTALTGESTMSAGQDVLIHPLGVAYVILGSRMGAGVIGKRLDASPAQWNADITAYFRDRGSLAHWKRLEKQLSAIDSPAEQDAIVEAAHAAFGVFEQSALGACEQYGHRTGGLALQ